MEHLASQAGWKDSSCVVLPSNLIQLRPHQATDCLLPSLARPRMHQAAKLLSASMALLAGQAVQGLMVEQADGCLHAHMCICTEHTRHLVSKAASDLSRHGPGNAGHDSDGRTACSRQQAVLIMRWAGAGCVLCGQTQAGHGTRVRGLCQSSATPKPSWLV